MSGDETLEADEFVCVECGVVAREHPLDGMAECEDCARKPLPSPYPAPTPPVGPVPADDEEGAPK